MRISHNKLMNSKPCCNCVNFMKKYNIKKVYYSVNNDTMYQKKLKKLLQCTKVKEVIYTIILNNILISLLTNNYDN